MEVTESYLKLSSSGPQTVCVLKPCTVRNSLWYFTLTGPFLKDDDCGTSLVWGWTDREEPVSSVR